MKISVVVPTLNAGARLRQCLEALADADEIIVADGGSSDCTQAIAEECGARLIQAPRGRGSQLAAGAAAATGELLLFVHADTCVSPGWADEARRAAGGTRPACFRFRLDDGAWQARLIERGVALRTRLLGLPYGDQALVVRRDIYDRSGGYRPLPLMEDVDILRRLERPIMLQSEALTSADRWRQDGWFRRSFRNLACLFLWKVGFSPDRVAALYDRRRPALPSTPGPAARAE